MKTEDKFIIFIYLGVLTFLILIFISLPFGLITYDNGMFFVAKLFREYRWYYILPALLLIGLNIKLIFGVIYGEGNGKIGVTKFTPEGEVNISFETIKTLVIKCVTESSGLKDIKVMVKPGKDSISIMIKSLILPELSIPPTALAVQESVKAYIEAITEIKVSEVKILVAGIAVDTKLRFE